MSRPLRIALLLTPSMALATFGMIQLSQQLLHPNGSSGTGNGNARTKLVVVAVFDQFRGDYPERWKTLMGDRGFQRIAREGTVYREAHLPYANTSTGPGHASIGTGLAPRHHGIIENRWYDRKARDDRYSTAGLRKYPRVPADSRDRDDEIGLSPGFLLTPGLGDRLKQQHPEHSRVWSVALKDRAAVLMGGQRPNGCYCFDTRTGTFHSSGYYSDSAPAWISAFNSSGIADQWFGKSWDRLGSVTDYDRLAGPDDAIGESSGVNKQGRAFPHPMSLGQSEPNRVYYDVLENSPFGNELLWEFARAAIKNEQLGKGPGSDLLFIGFSSTDLIGHTWGPDSHEVLDTALRVDQLLAKMMDDLDSQLGPDQYTLIVTADHGVAPLPERLSAHDPAELRYDPAIDLEGLNLAIERAFGQSRDPAPKWVEKLRFPEVYLNRTLIQQEGLPFEDVADYAASWAANRNHFHTAFSRSVILGPATPEESPFLSAVREGYHPDRSGDVVIIPRRYTLPMSAVSTGTSHGTPYEYDTHVILMARGAGVASEVVIPEQVNALLLGSWIAELLAITDRDRLTPRK